MKPVLDVVIPVCNEAADLERSVRRRHGYLLSVSPFPFRITIADNASTDATPLIAGRLAAEMPEVVAVYLAEKGRLILRATLGARFSDAQCGFKAIRAEVAHQLLPLVQDTNWFFDTELLVLAERAGMRTHEVPVDWVDDPNSKVDIIATAREDLRGIARLRRTVPALPLREIKSRLGRTESPVYAIGKIGASATEVTPQV